MKSPLKRLIKIFIENGEHSWIGDSYGYKYSGVTMEKQRNLNVWHFYTKGTGWCIAFNSDLTVKLFNYGTREPMSERDIDEINESRKIILKKLEPVLMYLGLDKELENNKTEKKKVSKI